MKFEQRELAKLVTLAQETIYSPKYQAFLFSLLDLTSLKGDETPALLQDLCEKANAHHVAAVCVYPHVIPTIKSLSHLPIATVINFPEGKDSLETSIAAIQQSLSAGASEIDLVFPYHDFLMGQRQACRDYIQQCKKTCGSHPLKVILETAAFYDLDLIADATYDAMMAGADFIKTSTGKKGGATLEAAASILLTLREQAPILKRTIGFKVSGGIRQAEQAFSYVFLASTIMGENWVTPNHFRIGTSQLLS